MDELEKAKHLQNEINNVILRHVHEYKLLNATVLGVIEIIKNNIILTFLTNDDNERGE